jgi:VWFA-related protein
VVYVSAVDANQRPVPGLTPDAFVIREDGVRREVLRVTPATSPMPVAIIVDNSQAAEPAIADLRRALAGFVRAIDGLGPVALVTVADRPTIVADYTPTAKTVLDAVDRLFHAPNSGATLLDAMRDIANGLTRREADRAAMVVVTTENTEFSHARYQDVLDSIRKAGVTTHVVVLTNPNVSMASEEARSRATVLDRGPRESGGLRMDLLTSMAFEPRLADLAAVLRAQYRIVYARPDALIPPERVTVTAAQAGIAMHGAPARGQGAK